MKRISILFVSLCCYCMIGQSQDLINNTLKGIPYTKQDGVENRTSELIESRKISDARFIKNSPFEYKKVSREEAYQDYVSEAVFFTLDNQQLQTLRTGDRDIILQIPVSTDRSIELELTRGNITIDDFQILTGNGEKEYRHSGLFYRGVVKDDPHSFAVISIFDDHIRGLIADDGGNYILGKVGERKEDYILYNDRNLLIKSDITCEVSEEDFPADFPTPNNDAESLVVGEKCVQVYVVCDFSMYNSFDDVGSTAKFVLALFHESAVIYFNENIEIEISGIRVWDTEDPWVDVTGSAALKNAFAASTTNFQGLLAHLLTNKAGVSGGFASGASYCGNETHAVSSGLNSIVSFPTYSWEVLVFTHEMGHQLGSPHTHACKWNGDDTQIDDCGNIITGGDQDGIDQGCFIPGTSTPIIPSGGGTIMSYCHTNGVGINFNLGFGTQPGDRIRGKIDAATCFDFECDCTDFVNRTMNSINYLPRVYSASNSISAQGGVDRPDHEPVIFRTDNYIQLTNFTATSGSTFLATISAEICDNNIFFNSPSTNNFVEIENYNKTLTENNEEAISDLFIQTHDLQIYPIPFTNSVTVEFNLEESDLVDIKILNVSGQLISNLQSKSTMDKGWHKLEYDTTTLPAGVYQLWFQTSKGTTVRKLIRVH